MDFLPSKIVEKSQEALSIKYNTIVYEKQDKGEDVIILSLGEAYFDLPLYSFNDLPKEKIFHYSHSKGIKELRKKLSEYYKKNYEIPVDFEKEILITAGSKLGIHMSLMTILNPDDEVLIHEPAWVSYTEEVKLCYGKPIHIPYNKSVLDFEEFISNKTKLIIINNPNNPTGKVFTKKELEHLFQLAKKHNLIILSDEAYSDFLENQKDFHSMGEFDIGKKQIIIVNSMSKNYGMSGWRVGYVISNEKFIDQILKVNQHLMTCPPTILEYYLNEYFHEIIQITKPQIQKLLGLRKDIEEYMNSISLKIEPGKATFYFFISINDSKLSSSEFAYKLLMEENVSVVPGLGYGKSCDKFIRVSIGTESPNRIKKGLEKIKDLIQKTS